MKEKQKCQHPEIFPFAAFLIRGSNPQPFLLLECPECGEQFALKGKFLESLE